MDQRLTGVDRATTERRHLGPHHGPGHGFIEVRSIYPTGAPLPIAKNGYYAHSLPASIIAAAGGPVAYIDVMLAAEGGSP
jgi:hypothetical protein